MTSFEKWKSELTEEKAAYLYSYNCTICPLRDLGCPYDDCSSEYIEQWFKREAKEDGK